jgi:short-subunit dehydrogenase
VIKTRYSVPALAITGSILDSGAKIIAEVESELGPMDVLVKNAGIQRMSRFASETDLSGWWKTVELNLLGPISMIHAVLPGFKVRGHGTIITVGSAVADITVPFMSSYQASKAGLHKAIQSLDAELSSQGIMNFLIHPGNIATDLALGDGVVGEEMKEIMKGFVPYMNDTVELPAWSMVTLAVLSGEDEGKDERVKVLSGRYWDVEDDLGMLLEHTKEIEERGLYHLRTRKL